MTLAVTRFFFLLHAPTIDHYLRPKEMENQYRPKARALPPRPSVLELASREVSLPRDECRLSKVREIFRSSLMRTASSAGLNSFSKVAESDTAPALLSFAQGLKDQLSRDEPVTKKLGDYLLPRV